MSAFRRINLLSTSIRDVSLLFIKASSSRSPRSFPPKSRSFSTNPRSVPPPSKLKRIAQGLTLETSSSTSFPVDMAEGGDGSKGRKWSWSKTFKSIGRSGRKAAVTDSFGPSSELDLSWDPQATYSTPIDFAPSHSPLAPHPPSSHKHSLSFGRSKKGFTPQPESFSSAPFCPPSPTASQYETHLAPRPPTQHPPPRSASLPLGGGKKKKRLGSPRLKSPRTGGPLKPFGRKPDVATLDEVLGIRATPNHSPNPSRSSASTLLAVPRPTSPPSAFSLSPPPAPVSHLRSPPGRRRLGSPPLHHTNRKPKAFGAKVKDQTTRAVHALSRAVSTISSSASTRSRENSFSNSDSGMSSSRRIDSTSSAATSVPTRSSHASRDSAEDFKLVADEELRKLVAEGKARSRTTSTTSSADGWGGSESSRTTNRSNATFGHSSSFSHLVDLHAPASPPPSSSSHSNNHASPLSFANRVYQTPSSPRGNGHFSSKSTSAAQIPLPISPSSSTTSLRSLGSMGHAQHSSLRSLGFGDIFGRRPSLPTLLSTIASGNGQDSDEEQAEFERGQQSPRIDVEVEEMKEVGLLGDDLPSWDQRRGSASGSEVDDAEAVLGELMIKLTSPRMDEGGDDDDAVDVWTSGTPIGTLSPVDETRSERSRKSTSSDMTSVADLIPLFRSPPTSPPFTPRKSGQFSPRNSYAFRMSTTSTLPSNTVFPPSPLSFSSQGFHGDSPQAQSLFGDYSINSTTDSYRPGSSCLDGLHPTSSPFQPYRSPSPIAPDVRHRPMSPESMLPTRPSFSSERSSRKKSSKRTSRDLPLLPPPACLPPPPPPPAPALPPPPTPKLLPPTPTPSTPPSPTHSLSPSRHSIESSHPPPSPTHSNPPSHHSTKSQPPTPPSPAHSDSSSHHSVKSHSPPPSPTESIHLNERDASRPPSPELDDQSITIDNLLPPPSQISPPPTANSFHPSEAEAYDHFESSGGFWERRGSTGGDSLLDLYSSSNCFYFSPTRETEEYTFDREETTLPSSPSASGRDDEEEEEREEVEGDAWDGGGVEELEETNSFDGSYGDEDSHVIILPPRPRTDIVPPRAPGLHSREEDEVPPSPAFAFDL